MTTLYSIRVCGSIYVAIAWSHIKNVFLIPTFIMRIYWFYYRSLLVSALAFAFFLSIISFNLEIGASAIKVDWANFHLKKFIFLFSTFGFSLSALLDSYFYKDKKYIYYNLGYSRRRIFLVLSIFNLIIMGLLWVLL